MSEGLWLRKIMKRDHNGLRTGSHSRGGAEENTESSYLGSDGLNHIPRAGRDHMGQARSGTCLPEDRRDQNTGFSTCSSSSQLPTRITILQGCVSQKTLFSSSKTKQAYPHVSLWGIYNTNPFLKTRVSRGLTS